MDRNNTPYGSVIYSKKRDLYLVYFWSPLEKKALYKVKADTREEGQELLNNLNFEFFSKYSQLLPKSISVNRRDRVFQFTIKIRGKTVRIYHSKDLNEVVNSKFDLMKQIFN